MGETVVELKACPREPTSAMFDAAWHLRDIERGVGGTMQPDWTWTCGQVWRAMFDAAPAVPQAMAGIALKKLVDALPTGLMEGLGTGLTGLHEAIEFAQAALAHQQPSPVPVGEDLPTLFEAWWATSPRRNREEVGYGLKKVIAFEAFCAGHACQPIPPEGEDDVAVTQEDRDAAASFYRYLPHVTRQMVLNMRSGKMDEHSFVQAFAAHRKAALARAGQGYGRGVRDAAQSALAWFEAAGVGEAADAGKAWLDEGGLDLEAPRVVAALRSALAAPLQSEEA